MWPSTTGYQCDIDESIDGSQTTSSSLVSSIGVIGRKNLRADAPVFKASISDVTYTTSCEAVIDETTGRLEQEVYYSQSSVNEYPMNERLVFAIDVQHYH